MEIFFLQILHLKLNIKEDSNGILSYQLILDLQFRGYIPKRIKEFLMEPTEEQEEGKTKEEAKLIWGRYIKNEEGIHNPLQFNIKKVKIQGEGYLELTINKIDVNITIYTCNCCKLTGCWTI